MSFALPEQFSTDLDHGSACGLPPRATVLAGHPPSRLAALLMRPPEGAWTREDQDAFDAVLGGLVALLSVLTVLGIPLGVLAAALI